jgi:hypothetical protein
MSSSTVHSGRLLHGANSVVQLCTQSENPTRESQISANMHSARDEQDLLLIEIPSTVEEVGLILYLFISL